MAGVFATQPVEFATIAVDNSFSQNRFTGFSIANPNNENINIRIVVLNTDGSVTDTISPPELNPLGPQRQVSKFLHEYLPARATFRGSLVLLAQGGRRFVATALIQYQGLLTATPVTPAKPVTVTNWRPRREPANSRVKREILLDAEHLIGSLIQDALFSRKKRRRGVERFLTGGRNSFLNASTLLTAAGLVWGLVESSTASTGGTPPAPAGGPSPPVPTSLPPLPGEDASRADPSKPGGIPDEVLRLVRLTVSAARADGELSADETERIVNHARKTGAEALVERELLNPKPLAEIVSGVSDPQLRADLYTLAFAIVRADEGVSGAERIYLAQLAHHLGLDGATREHLERQAAAKIVEAAELA